MFLAPRSSVMKDELTHFMLNQKWYWIERLPENCHLTENCLIDIQNFHSFHQYIVILENDKICTKGTWTMMSHLENNNYYLSFNTFRNHFWQLYVYYSTRAKIFTYNQNYQSNLICIFLKFIAFKQKLRQRE